MQTVVIHISERSDSKPDERYFDGWVEGWQNVVSVPTMTAKGSKEAIAWRVKVVSEISAHARCTGQDVDIRNVHENF
jgi:hypothetical protein